MTPSKDQPGKVIDLFSYVCLSFSLATKTIHDVVRTNNVKELELIVGRGASVNEVDVHNNDKFTPLHWAAYSGSLEV